MKRASGFALDEQLANGLALENAGTVYSGERRHYDRNYTNFLRIYANTAISIASTKNLTVKLQQSDDNVTFTNVNGVVVYSNEGVAKDFEANEVIGEIIVPETFITKKYVRISITTDYDGTSQKVDVNVETL